MLFDSKKIEGLAIRHRAKMTEAEARVVELLVLRHCTFEEIAEKLAITLESVHDIRRKPQSNLFFWMLLALINAKEAELYSKAHDRLKAEDPVNLNPQRVLH